MREMSGIPESPAGFRNFRPGCFFTLTIEHMVNCSNQQSTLKLRRQAPGANKQEIKEEK
jgi:hypothetical protein